MFVAIFVAIKRTESTRAFLYIQFSQYISRYTGTAAHATPADVASRFRGRANRSWSTRRAAFPMITSPRFSDEPTHDDDHVGEGHPEVYNPPFPLGAPHQLLVGVLPGVGALHHPTVCGPKRGRLPLLGDHADQVALC